MNNAPASARVGMIVTSRDEDMAGFDALPAGIRAALHEFPIPLLSASAARAVARYGVDGALQIIQQEKAHVEEQMRLEMAEACAR